MVEIQNKCSICQQVSNNLTVLCLGGHLTCYDCAVKWANNATKLACFDQSCDKEINCYVVIGLLHNSKLLPKLKPLFKEVGITYNTCFSCLCLIDLDYSKKATRCACGQEICNNCTRKAHLETCFYYESHQDFEIIDLPPPNDVSMPQNLKEQEYIKAKYAFENFLENQGAFSFKSAKLIVNKKLEKRYFDKKAKMIIECNGENNIGEVHIWHGSRFINYQSIMEDGLLVGGVDYNNTGAQIPIANAMVHGYGVYSSTTPDTPIQYACDSHFIIACLAMKGLGSNVKITDVNLLDNPNWHSYKPINIPEKNWVVFFTKEQILPRFLIEYSINA